jgi:hypothetical protein
MVSGHVEDWLRIVTNPRYQLQQIKRNAASVGQVTDSPLGLAGLGPDDPALPISKGERVRRKPLHGDWTVMLSGGGNASVATDMFAAKYTFAPIGTPDCINDFVVFPVNASGNSGNQANILGVNNLYSGTCTGTVPTVLFSYFVGTGKTQTSLALSLDGTKVAFIESAANASNFHVLTLDKSGNSGCPSSSPCNGTAFNSPATPGTRNSAVDTKITMSGGVSVTRSSPFVDYSHDVAYVGDDTGKLHKFTAVFTGTPAEVTTSPWPFTVANGVILAGPAFDSGASQNIFIGGSDGKLYCVTSAGTACSTPSITVGTGAILDAPIIDITAQTVFAAANNSTNAVLTQATTKLGAQVNATMGTSGATPTNLYDGAFDNAYFTNISTGHMYFCGNLTSAATPTLWRVGFDTSPPTMNSLNDGNSFQLVTTGSIGSAVNCTPLTEVFNTAQNQDYLFLGVTDHGFQGSAGPNCANHTCIISFALPTDGSFPATANATMAGGALGSHGISGIIIDNVAGAQGASQVYFGNLQNQTGVQASQSALQ